MDLIERITALVAAHPHDLGFVLLGVCAFLEYVFPPFPGDAITLFAAFLVGRRGWPWPPVLLSLLAGSAAGSLVVYAAGRALVSREVRWTGWLARARPRIDELVGRFARHGALYLAINRFLPSVRAFFFLAAGMARLRLGDVLLFGMISALAWNGLLLVIGATVGGEWSHVVRIFQLYGVAAWSAVLLIAAGLLSTWWWRRRRTSGR